MSTILKVRNVNDYARYVGCAEQHPLVCVIDYAEVSPVRHTWHTAAASMITRRVRSSAWLPGR